MQKRRVSLVVLHTDRAFRERLHRAAASRFALHVIDDWSGLRDRLRRLGAGGIVVVDPYHRRGSGEGIAPELRALLRAFPSATVIAALGERRGWMRDVRELGERGVADVIDLGVEDTVVAVRQRLEAARGRPLRLLLDRELDLRVSGWGRAIVDAAIEIAIAGGFPRDLARVLGVSNSTLLRWCRRFGVPVPRRLLLWMRLLLAAELLDDPGRSVLDVALTTHYSSDRALRRALYVAVGLGPRALRGRGAFPTAARAFAQEVRRRRGGEVDREGEPG